MCKVLEVLVEISKEHKVFKVFREIRVSKGHKVFRDLVIKEFRDRKGFKEDKVFKVSKV